MRALRASNLVLVALTLGLLFAHLLEWPGKQRLDGATWLAVQQNLYIGFGTVGAAIEVLAIASSWLLALLLRGRPGGRAALFAAFATSAGLAVWASVTAPANTTLSGWTAASLPPDWADLRTRWEASHALHAAAFAAAFLALLSSILPARENPR